MAKKSASTKSDPKVPGKKALERQADEAKKAAKKAKTDAEKAREKAKADAKKAKQKAKLKADADAEKADKRAAKTKKRAADAAAEQKKEAKRAAKTAAADLPSADAETVSAEWTVIALRAKARAQGVVGYSRLSKAQLIERLQS